MDEPIIAGPLKFCHAPKLFPVIRTNWGMSKTVKDQKSHGNQTIGKPMIGWLAYFEVSIFRILRHIFEPRQSVHVSRACEPPTGNCQAWSFDRHVDVWHTSHIYEVHIPRPIYLSNLRIRYSAKKIRIYKILDLISCFNGCYNLELQNTSNEWVFLKKHTQNEHKTSSQERRVVHHSSPRSTHATTPHGHRIFLCSDIAMENGLFMDDFLIKSSIYEDE